MSEIIKETTVTHGEVNSSAPKASNSQSMEYIIYFIFGLLEILLAFRFILRLTGASTASAFVRGLYSITGFFVRPFEGIFGRVSGPGLESASVFEPATLMALLVFSALAWGIVKAVQIGSGEKLDS